MKVSLLSTLLLLGFSGLWAEEGEDQLTWQPEPTMQGEQRHWSAEWRSRVRQVNPPSEALQEAPPAFHHNTLIEQRVLLSWGDTLQGGFLLRRPPLGPAFSWPDLRDYGGVKYSLGFHEPSLGRVMVGRYQWRVGQGLVFYDQLGETVRPVRVKGGLPRAELTAGVNSYLNGVAVSRRMGESRVTLFQSLTSLDAPLTSLGRADVDLLSLRDQTGELADEEDVSNDDTLKENLWGVRAEDLSLGLGATFYDARYSRTIDPDTSLTRFRGDRNRLAAADWDHDWSGGAFFGEVARSWAGPDPKSGTAGTCTLWLKEDTPLAVWASLFHYDASFTSRHGKGLAFAVMGGPENLPRNQRGVVLGMGWKKSRREGQVTATLARFPSPLGETTGSYLQGPSAAEDILGSGVIPLNDDSELRFRLGYRHEERIHRSEGISTTRDNHVTRARLEWRWKASPTLSGQMRGDFRRDRGSAQGQGRLFMMGLTFRPLQGWRVEPKLYVFHSPEAYLTTGSEEIWDGVYFPRLAGSLGNLRGAPGIRQAVVVSWRGGAWTVWTKFDQNRRWPDADAAEEQSRRSVHLEVSWAWREG